MLFWLSAERGFSQAAYSYLCEEVLWFEGRWSDRHWMETGAFLLPSRITWISSTSSAANPPKEERTSQPILAQRVRTRRPVADDDNTSLNITSAQLYLDDIRSENMNRAHQLIFWSLSCGSPVLEIPGWIGSGISYCFKVAWRLCGDTVIDMFHCNMLRAFWENRASVLVPLVRFTSMQGFFFFYSFTKLKSYFGVIVSTWWRRSSRLHLRWSTSVLWSRLLDPSVRFIVLVCLLFRWWLSCLFLVTEVLLIILLCFLSSVLSLVSVGFHFSLLHDCCVLSGNIA